MKALIISLFFTSSISLANVNAGRFQIVETQVAVLMIDSQTGKIWRRTCLLKEGETLCQKNYIWMAEPVMDINTTMKKVDEFFIKDRTDK